MMLNRYDTWTYGLKMLAFVAMCTALPPAAIALFLSFLSNIILLVIPDHDPAKYYNDIFFCSYIIFGPYYLGKEWDRVEELAKNLREDYKNDD